MQEVYATAEAVETFLPGTDAVVELGGEDAKIIFFGGALEERMNGSCAGGTGAFIDQMATLMNVSADELDRLSEHYEKIYPIASRCGVFAKSDIQPILNQGGRKEDVAASIFQAVVDQTVSGLSQGREIKGQVAFLGGPPPLSQGAAQAVSADPAPGRSACAVSGKWRLLCRHRRGALRPCLRGDHGGAAL